MNLVDASLNFLSKAFSMRRRVVLVKRINEIRFSSRITYRRELYESQKKTNPAEWCPKIKIKDGYAFDLSKSVPFLIEVMRDAKEIFNTRQEYEKYARKPFLINFLNKDDLKKYPSFLNMATSVDLLSIAADYLGFIPVLSQVSLWRSEAETDQLDKPKSSQLYHLDNADAAQVKVFIHVGDVDEKNGPLTFLGAKDSKKVISKTGYGRKRNVERLSDKSVYAVVPKDNAIKCTLGEGSIVYVDTIKCLHFGSRRNVRNRDVLMLQYLSPCRADFRQNNLSKFIHTSDSNIRKLSLDPTIS